MIVATAYAQQGYSPLCPKQPRRYCDKACTFPRSLHLLENHTSFASNLVEERLPCIGFIAPPPGIPHPSVGL
jgi:hypothetical protein